MKIDKIETNIEQNKFLTKYENLTPCPISNNKVANTIIINVNDTDQEFLGFGGAFTESTGYALSTVDENIRNQIVDDYYSSDGIGYSLGRLPIASCDFSLNSYSYSYKDDLSDFSIERDMKYIIPIIKNALKRNKNIKFISSPWSPPAFMKDNKKLTRGGKLKPEYRQLWADYLVKYVNFYKNQGINIDYMTIQNEPNVSQLWESCRYTAEGEADLLKKYLYPTFKQNNLSTNFLIWDHNKDDIVKRVEDTFIKYGALDYATGISFHWYTGSFFENIEKLHEMFPNKLLIHTEGCTGYSKFKPKDELFNAEMYANEIIGDLNAGTNAFVDWNLVLDYKGGPNHKRNYCNSPIMINKHKNGYIKTPAFYYIGQFSKYIKPEAKRIKIDNSINDLKVTSFINKDSTVVIVLLNNKNNDIEYNIQLNNETYNDIISNHSIITLVINK